MKKSFTLLSIIALLFTVTTAAVAAPINVGVSYGTITGLGTNDLRTGIMNIISVLLGFIGIIAIVVVLWGGFRWMTSVGSEEKITEAKKIIMSGIVGLIIIFTSYALVSFVITNLLEATGAL